MAWFHYAGSARTPDGRIALRVSGTHVCSVFPLNNRIDFIKI
jgi:hypothetical protein